MSAPFQLTPQATEDLDGIWGFNPSLIPLARYAGIVARSPAHTAQQARYAPSASLKSCWPRRMKSCVTAQIKGPFCSTVEAGNGTGVGN